MSANLGALVASTPPSARNGYAGSAARWLATHTCDLDACGSIEFLPSYRVSSCGAVWGSGKTRGAAYREMKLTPGRGGYLWAMVRRNGKVAKVCAHRLVARAFLGAKPPGGQVRHLDGNCVNNAVSNLAWGSAAENTADRERHGRTARGEANGASRHTDAEVAAAREMLDSGVSQRAVAAAFSCSQSTVWRWRHGVRRAALLAAPPKETA